MSASTAGLRGWKLERRVVHADWCFVVVRVTGEEEEEEEEGEGDGDGDGVGSSFFFFGFSSEHGRG